MNIQGNIEKIRLFIIQGDKEEKLTDGTIKRIALTEQDIATYKQILEFLETPPVEVNLDEALREFDFKLQNQIENCGFEALLWLESASQNRGFTGGAGNFSALTGQKAIAFVEKIYALGAECVSVIDVIPNANEGLQTVESVIVTLPAGKAARRRIFDWEKQFVRKQAFSPTPNVGQKYLLVKWD